MVYTHVLNKGLGSNQRKDDGQQTEDRESTPSQEETCQLVTKERGQINFPNYASQLQAIFARSKSTKILK